MPGLFERTKKRHPLFALIFGGVIIFLDNVGRAQVLRDTYDGIKMIWTNIHVAWPGHLLTWLGAAIAIYGFASLLWPSKRAQEAKVEPTVLAESAEEEELPKALPMSKPPLPGRIFVGPNITPAYLRGLFDNRTSVQGEKLCEPFLGKWMRILGKVLNISEHDTDIMIVLGQPSGKSPGIGCSFAKDKWNDRISILLLQDKITVIGKIRAIEKYWVWLSECELDD